MRDDDLGAPHHRRISRRAFLRTAGATVVAGTATSLLGPGVIAAAPISPFSSGKNLNIGVLVPRSTLYPNLRRNLLAGMRLHLDRARLQSGGLQVQVLGREIGVSARAAVDQVSQLVSENRPDLIVGLTNPHTAGPLRAVFAAKQVPFLALSTGENLPRAAAHSEYIFHNSLLGWQSAWGLGSWAVRHMGETAVIASSLYDSGYDTLTAFRTGFEQAGGRMLATNVSHMPGHNGDLTPLMAAIKQAQPDFVYAAYCGKPALDFVKAYAEAGLAGRVPLVATPFLVDEELLPAHGEAALGIRSAFSWSPYAESAENQQFQAAYQAKTGYAADAFAVLGYEAAQLIDAAVQTNRADLRAALEQVSFAGPRGLVTTQVAPSAGSTRLMVREVRRQNHGLANLPIAELAPIDEAGPHVASLRASLKTGWTNAYLCVG